MNLHSITHVKTSTNLLVTKFFSILHHLWCLSARGSGGIYGTRRPS